MTELILPLTIIAMCLVFYWQLGRSYTKYKHEMNQITDEDVLRNSKPLTSAIISKSRRDA